MREFGACGASRAGAGPERPRFVPSCLTSDRIAQQRGLRAAGKPKPAAESMARPG